MLRNAFENLATEATLAAIKTAAETQAAKPNAPTSISVNNLPTTQPISGSITVNNFTDNGLTDAQLRATAVPISLNSVHLDSFTNAIKTIDIIHYTMHAGKFFTHSGIINVANSAVQLHLIQVPAGVYPHMRHYTIDTTSAPLQIDFYESPITSNNGTLQSVMNNNRNSANVNQVNIYHDPVVTSEGTHLFSSLVTGSKQTGGSGAESFSEVIMKPSTNYLFKITNVSGAAAMAACSLEWYEG